MKIIRSRNDRFHQPFVRSCLSCYCEKFAMETCSMPLSPLTSLDMTSNGLNCFVVSLEYCFTFLTERTSACVLLNEDKAFQQIHETTKLAFSIAPSGSVGSDFTYTGATSTQDPSQSATSCVRWINRNETSKSFRQQFLLPLRSWLP